MLRDFSFSANIRKYFSFPSPTTNFCLRCVASCQTSLSVYSQGSFSGVFHRESHCQHHDWVKCFAKRPSWSFSVWQKGCSPCWPLGLLFSSLQPYLLGTAWFWI